MTAPSWPSPPVPAVDTGRRHSWEELKHWRWGSARRHAPPPARIAPREPGDDDDVGEDEQAGLTRPIA